MEIEQYDLLNESFVSEIKVNENLNSTVSDIQIKNILRERAKLYAKSPQKESHLREKLDLIVFELGKEKYGLESKYIREVFPLKEYTSLPGIPDFILGIANIRSRIVAMVNLKKLFDLPKSGIGDFNKLIILQDKDTEFGILADKIEGFSFVYTDTINPYDSSKVNSLGFIKGIDKNKIIVLKTQDLIEKLDLMVNQESK